jgi:hypothetical protein
VLAAMFVHGRSAAAEHGRSSARPSATQHPQACLEVPCARPARRVPRPICHIEENARWYS